MKMKTWLLLAGAALLWLTPREVLASGACTAARFHDWNDMGCNQNCASAGTPPKGGCPPCNGMPRWWVSEPYINLCMADTPLSATDEKPESLGERLALPPLLEGRRTEIEAGLKPLKT